MYILVSWRRKPPGWPRILDPPIISFYGHGQTYPPDVGCQGLKSSSLYSFRSPSPLLSFPLLRHGRVDLFVLFHFLFGQHRRKRCVATFSPRNGFASFRRMPFSSAVDSRQSVQSPDSRTGRTQNHPSGIKLSPLFCLRFSSLPSFLSDPSLIRLGAFRVRRQSSVGRFVPTARGSVSVSVIRVRVFVSSTRIQSF